MSIRSSGSAIQSHLNERLAQSLSQMKGPDAAVLCVLCVALVLGLIGLAVDGFWAIAVIVTALGLGFTLANGRWHHIEAVNRRHRDAEDKSGAPLKLVPSFGKNTHESRES